MFPLCPPVSPSEIVSSSLSIEEKSSCNGVTFVVGVTVSESFEQDVCIPASAKIAVRDSLESVLKQYFCLGFEYSDFVFFWEVSELQQNLVFILP